MFAATRAAIIARAPKQETKRGQRNCLIGYELKSIKVRNESIPKKKLLSRFGKVTARFVNEIEYPLPIVISDADETDKLHQLKGL